MLTSSVTGAGLVIAFYALIAKMSDNIFECRFELLDEKKREFQRIRNNPNSFTIENFKSSSSRLKELIDEIDSFRTYPRYLKNGIAFTFALFIVAAFTAFVYLYIYTNVTETLSYLLIGIYLVSIFAFFVIGIYGLYDVNETMTLQFRRLAKKKTELKEEIRQAPKAVEIFNEVHEALVSLGVRVETTAMYKINGKPISPDVVIPPTAIRPKFVIEVMSEPNIDTLFRRSLEFEKFKKEIYAKSILVAKLKSNNFSSVKPYWDYVIDISKDDVKQKLTEILT